MGHMLVIAGPQEGAASLSRLLFIGDEREELPQARCNSFFLKKKAGLSSSVIICC